MTEGPKTPQGNAFLVDAPDPRIEFAPVESPWVAFTDFVYGGRSWKVTIRDGMDETKIDNMFAMILRTSEWIDLNEDKRPAPAAAQVQEAPRKASNGLGVSAVASTPSARPEAAQTPPAARSGGRPTAGVEKIDRIVVAGTLDDPAVQFWSENRNLKFPVLTTKSHRVIGMLQDAYGADLSQEDLDALNVCGTQIPVAWEASWEQSPKNEKWKDLTGIRIPKFEQGGS